MGGVLFLDFQDTIKGEIMLCYGVDVEDIVKDVRKGNINCYILNRFYNSLLWFDIREGHLDWLNFQIP